MGLPLRDFKINYIKLEDTATGALVWSENRDLSSREQFWEIKLPISIFDHKSITIEVNFTSTEPWNNFIMKPMLVFHGVVLEEFCFEYGVVFPNSINTLRSVITALPEEDFLTLDIACETSILITEFYDGDTVITRSYAKVFYED